MNPEQVPVLLFALAVIVTAAQAFGALARRAGQPPVIGEILLGVLIGPTFFGGAVAAFLFPAEIRPLLSVLANVGVALFMFTVGTEVDRRLLRGHGRMTLSVASASMALPLLLGCGLALYLSGHYESSHRVGFVLFLGTAMAVTAFPVLARILTDRGMQRTTIGGLALSCAAVADLLAWTLLAVIATIVGGAHRPQWVVAMIIPFTAFLLLVVRPLLGRIANDSRPRTLAVALVGLLACGAATEWMGLHYIFGCFLFGLVMPTGARESFEGTARLAGVLLLPTYFIVAGLNVDLSSMRVTNVADLVLIMLVSVGGKFAGTMIAARLHRVEWRQAATLGTLMNARGLTELIVLTTGLQLGLLDTGLYSLMVLMALLTTAMTGPLLQLLHREDRVPQDFLATETEVSRRSR